MKKIDNYSFFQDILSLLKKVLNLVCKIEAANSGNSVFPEYSEIINNRTV